MFKKSFIEAQVDNGGREDIIQFIANIRFYDDYIGNETVRRLFHRGYCYYFAHILQQAFKCGEIVCSTNKYHWLFKYDGVFYDIEGVYDVTEDDDIVPELDMSEADLAQYLHVPRIPVGNTECAQSKIDTQDAVVMQDFFQYIDNRFCNVV